MSFFLWIFKFFLLIFFLKLYFQVPRKKLRKWEKIMGYISFGTRFFFFVVAYSRNATMLAHLFMGCSCQKMLYISSQFLRFFVVKRKSRQGKKCIGEKGGVVFLRLWHELFYSVAWPAIVSKVSAPLLLHALLFNAWHRIQKLSA